MRNYGILLSTLTVLVAMATVSVGAEISASLSAHEAYVGNPITLRVEVANAQFHQAPQLSPIAGVDVRSAGTPSRSSQVSIINGRRTAKESVTYAWQLTPRREGSYTIPAILVEADGQQQRTRPLRFAASKSETGDLLFAEIVGGTAKIFVGQPLELTLRIWIRPYADSRLDISLSAGDMWQLISQQNSNWGMFTDRLRELAEHQQRPTGEEVLRADSAGVDRRYYRYDIQATVYPQRPGQIDGDEIQIVVDYPTRLGKSRDPLGSPFDRGFPDLFGDQLPSMFGPRLAVTETRPIVAGAEVNATEVLAIPTAGRPADYQGAVGHYKIISQAAANHVKAGDPITLHLGIQGDGPMGLVQAPPLSTVPELAADFKVAAEPLAGIVQADVKLFAASIRPRREGITQIPSIPFSFFDPDKKEFVTVRSEPIAITVDAADQLTLDSIVGHSAGSPAGEASGTAATTLHLDNTSGDQALSSAGPASGWWLAWAAGIPPLLFLGSLCLRFRNRRSARGADAQLVALEQIGNASTAGEISAALQALIDWRLRDVDVPNPLASAADRMRGCVGEGTVSLIDSVMRRCAQASFAGTIASNLQQLAAEAADCVHRLDREFTAASQQATARCNDLPNSWSAVSAKSAAMAALLMAGFLLASKNCAATAAEFSAAQQLSPAQQLKVLAEANTAYAAGQRLSATDSAESQQAFSTAAQKYQTLVDCGTHSEPLYFNLGNAYLQSGSLGRAIANYELAVALNRSSLARDNLSHVRALLDRDAVAATDAGENFTAAIATWNSRIPRRAKLVMGLISWALAWLGAVGVVWKAVPPMQRVVAPAAIAALLCATSLAIDSYAPGHADHVIVVVPAAQMRGGNGAAFAAVGTALSAGTSCDVIQRRDDWIKVSTPKGPGWLHADDTVFVPAHA